MTLLGDICMMLVILTIFLVLHPEFRRTQIYRIYRQETKGLWWLRWYCKLRGHLWMGSNHPRIVECEICFATAVIDDGNNNR